MISKILKTLLEAGECHCLIIFIKYIIIKYSQFYSLIDLKYPQM